MSIFDLIFIAVFFATVGFAGYVGILLIRRRWSDARKRAIRGGIALGAYMALVVGVGLLSPQRKLPTSGNLRYDDWWLSVQQAAWVEMLGPDLRPPAGHVFLVVTLKVMSKARRTEQAAPAGSLVYLIDESGTRYEVSAPAQRALEKLEGEQPPLTRRLEPGTSFQTMRAFEVPRTTAKYFFGHRHGSGFLFPTLFIIGEGFRQPAVIRLQGEA